MSRLVHSAYKVTLSDHVLFQGPSVATLTITETAPTQTFKCEVELTPATGHTDLVGHVYINAEDLNFTSGTTKKKSTYNLSAVPTVTTSGLDCNIKITCIDTQLKAIQKETLELIDVRIWPKIKRVPATGGGWTSIQDTTVWTEDFTIKQNDFLKFDIDNPTDPTDGINHQVISVGPMQGLGGKPGPYKVLQF